MNIGLQCCGLAMTVVLLYLSRSEKGLDITSRRRFLTTLASCMVCLSLDILSIVAITSINASSTARLITTIICKAYVISLVLQAYEAFLYTASEFFGVGTHRLQWHLYRTLFFVGCFAVAALPISAVQHGRIVYTFGPSVQTAYAVVLVYIMSSIYMAFRGANHVPAHRRRCILLWQGCYLLAAIVQFFNPGILLAGFAVAFGMVLIYAELENPHEGIDRMTGEFTVNQLIAYVNDQFRNGRSFSAMLIRVEYRVQTIDPETERSVMLRISRELDADRSACVFRQADDEFVVIYNNAQEMEAAFERMQSKVTANLDFPARLWYTILPDSSILNSSDEFIRFHHYLQKNMQGVEVIIVDEQTISGIREYLRVQSMIGEALEEGRVEVFLQPIFNVASQRFTAAEALVRIRDTDGSLISPGLFIPIAEENGMIVPLGEEIFRQVCEFLSTGQAQQFGLEYVEVNLSVVQFDEENPATFVQHTMERYHVLPKWINLEITETASNSERRVLQINMDRLIKKGVHFSLDDFGTGRSNLDYFVDMPVDIIKFDYSFTQGYFESEKARYVVESMIELMQKMGLPIVAEGVETKDQLDAMIGLGISFIQGFYFSKPLPKDEFVEFLAERNNEEAVRAFLVA